MHHPFIPPRCYIAHPYTAGSPELTDMHVQGAKLAGLAAARRGWYPVMPTVNTGGFDRLAPEIDNELWLAGTLGLMRTCEAVLMAGDWTRSQGCRDEYADAMERGIPVYTLETLPESGIEEEDTTPSARPHGIDPLMEGGHA
ncbi:MAG: hypothetical protein Q8O14_14805 [bacterium]|nr:hypothetical protein [bacterium]